MSCMTTGVHMTHSRIMHMMHTSSLSENAAPAAIADVCSPLKSYQAIEGMLSLLTCDLVTVHQATP